MVKRLNRSMSSKTRPRLFLAFKATAVTLMVVATLATGNLVLGVSQHHKNQARSSVRVTVIPVPASDDSGKLSLSPDGNWITYPSRLGRGYGVALYQIKKNQRHNFAFTPPGGGIMDFDKAVWSPDSSKLYLGDPANRWFTQEVELRTPGLTRRLLPSNFNGAGVTCSDFMIAPSCVLVGEANASPFAPIVRRRILGLNQEATGHYTDEITGIYPAPNRSHLLCNIELNREGSVREGSQWFYVDLKNAASPPIRILNPDEGPDTMIVWSADSRKAYGILHGNLIVISVN